MVGIGGEAGVTLTREDVQEVLGIYVRAWETQDPDLIVTIFTPEATYHERVLGDPIPRPGRDPTVLGRQGGQGAGQRHLPGTQGLP